TPRLSSLARATCCRISSDTSVPIERRSSWRPCRARSSVATSTGHHPFLPLATVESASERFLPAPVRPNRTASERVPHLLAAEALERAEERARLGKLAPGGGPVWAADAPDAGGLGGPDPVRRVLDGERRAGRHVEQLERREVQVGGPLESGRAHVSN